MEKRDSIKEKFDLTVDVGEIILANGGEIFRAHETMVRMAKYFKLKNFDTYIIASGIFTSIAADGEYYTCQIRYTPMKEVDLSRVEAVNSLSRTLDKDALSVQELRAQIDLIMTPPKASQSWLKIIAAGISCGAFGYLFGGNVMDALASIIAGLIMCFVSRKVLSRLNFPKLMDIIICAALAASLCVLLRHLGLGNDLNYMIIGAIFPLVPGVSFTNGVRNLMDFEHLTGLIRLTDAAVTVTGAAIGVGIVLTLL